MYVIGRRAQAFVCVALCVLQLTQRDVRGKEVNIFLWSAGSPACSLISSFPRTLSRLVISPVLFPLLLKSTKTKGSELDGAGPPTPMSEWSLSDAKEWLTRWDERGFWVLVGCASAGGCSKFLFVSRPPCWRVALQCCRGHAESVPSDPDLQQREVGTPGPMMAWAGHRAVDQECRSRRRRSVVRSILARFPPSIRPHAPRAGAADDPFSRRAPLCFESQAWTSPAAVRVCVSRVAISSRHPAGSLGAPA